VVKDLWRDEPPNVPLFNWIKLYLLHFPRGHRAVRRGFYIAGHRHQKPAPFRRDLILLELRPRIDVKLGGEDINDFFGFHRLKESEPSALPNKVRPPKNARGCCRTLPLVREVAVASTQTCKKQLYCQFEGLICLL
jgi:hypothetical protein